MIAAFLDDIRDHDMIAPRRLAERLSLPLTRLAKLATQRPSSSRQ
ncbi:hypothetical protein [Serratia marcescens]|nr:hypothetical protein [Serratia marcescens]